MQGWRLLCKEYTPIFLEKSPHHLYQWSAIELILECIRTFDDVDFLLIGPIRNPLDTIYSQYRRRRLLPEKVERQWLSAYRNLQRLKDLAGEKLVIVRYEDMVSNLSCLAPVFDFCGVMPDSSRDTYFHQKSMNRAKEDARLCFVLSDETSELAVKYGYRKEELANQTHLL